MSLGRSRVASAMLLAFVVGPAGCAMIMQQPPKQNRAPREVPVCSTGRGGVALDGIRAALLGVGALAALAGEEEGAALGIGAVGGIYLFSAVTGYRSATACENALEDYQLEIAARRPATEPRAPAQASAGEAPVERPLGPPIEAAAPPEEEEQPEPPPAPASAPASAPPPAPGDWSDFWIEVAK